MSIIHVREEDEVRDGFASSTKFINGAKQILELDKPEKDVIQGTGQVYTFNKLGFKGVNDKPDGWYLPKNKSMPALILETKAEYIDINKQSCVDELIKNCKIVLKEYKKVVGILYNGQNTRVFLNNVEDTSITNVLQSKRFYLNLFNKKGIDKQKIYSLTKKINETLHKDFGINNLKHRMIFTACALVATKEGAIISKNMDYNDFHNAILNQLNKSLKESKIRNSKLQYLADIYSKIEMNSPDNQIAIDDFISNILQISNYITSDNWNGEDVMGIFFNEFNRYKGKSENGQVFTPDHITSLMYRLLEVNQNDVILDAACGSGAFLVKSMCNMIKEAGGVETSKAKDIKQNQLFGIEWDKEIFALACANMLIHKDGKTNLEQMDSRSDEACKWIKSKPITKVLMNPPFESKLGCCQIVKNVLDNVSSGTKCAFILPDKKFEKNRETNAKTKDILSNHRILKIIKLPDNTFFNVGASTSIFIFEAGIPQKNNEIFSCYIMEDGLETVKNQGRQDIKDKWNEIEDYWIDVIHKQSGDNSIQWLKPSEHLSYQMPEKEIEIVENDFSRTVVNYILYENNVNVKDFSEKLISNVLYNSEISRNNNFINIKMNSSLDYGIEAEKILDGVSNGLQLNMSSWKSFVVGELFPKVELKKYPKIPISDGDIPFISSTSFNNGVCKYCDEVGIAGNCITVSTNGKCFDCFYHKHNIVPSADVEVLYNDRLNLFNGLFLCTVLSKLREKYEYNDKPKNGKVFIEKIKLPVTQNGEVDFEYMEKYIQSLYLKKKKEILYLIK